MVSSGPRYFPFYKTSSMTTAVLPLSSVRFNVCRLRHSGSFWYMGQIASRFGGPWREREPPPNDEDAEQQISFPSTAGSYFGTHFLMCGGRFDIAKPEAYLFGENSDLDLLGSRAVPFPYASPLGSSEVHPLNLLINIRKESVKFSRIKGNDGRYDPNLYRLEFTLDAECPCFVQIHYNAREYHQDGNIHFAYRNKKVLHSDVYNFDMGCDQAFNHYTFDLSRWDIDDLKYGGGHYFPLVIVVQTEGIERPQTQTTMCTVEPANDASNMVILKPLRQKIGCDGVVYLLQEIFGIENKEITMDMGDEGGLECIICMSDVRDTVILPCRHLCICNNCADTLRYKANNCPICRSPFRALIHLRARRQARNQGYETVTLVEGLNGPLNPQIGAVDSSNVSEQSEEPGPKATVREEQKRETIEECADDDVEDYLESEDGIEMKRYVPRDLNVITYDETPVLSNVSSRSPSPNQYVTPEEIEVEIETRCSRRQTLQEGSRQSRSSLLEETPGNEVPREDQP